MAETHLKRQREEDFDYEFEDPSKRHKSYNDILSILEEDEDEPNQDLSDIFTSLQQELSSDSAAADPLTGNGGSEAESAHQTGGSAGPSSDECSPSSNNNNNNKEEEDERVRVMRHLLEASDDELGIPNRVESGDEETNSGEQLFSLGDGMWEFEDDAANYYYTLMQNELFM